MTEYEKVKLKCHALPGCVINAVRFTGSPKCELGSLFKYCI